MYNLHMTKWIKQIRYNDGGRIASGFQSSAGDCAVRALSILTGSGYMNVRNRMLDIISRERGIRSCVEKEGVYLKTIRKFLKPVCGFTWYSNTKWDKLPTEGRLLVVCDYHAVAVIDGVINDTFDPVNRTFAGKMRGYYILD